MSNRIIEALTAGYAAYARGDFEEAFQNLPPEFEVHGHLGPEDLSNHTGAEALRIADRQNREVFPDTTWEPLEFVELKDRMLVRVRIAGTGRHTRLHLEQELAHLWTLEAGRPIRLDIYPSWAEARSTVGLDD
jgi:ketosteroid isomerase-like protein